MPKPSYVYEFPDGYTLERTIEGSKDPAFQEWLTEMSLPDNRGAPKVREKGVSLGTKKAKGLLQVASEFMFPGQDADIFGSLSGLPRKTVDAAMDLVPEEVSAGAVRTAGDVIGPSLGAIGGGIAGAHTGPAAPKMIPAGMFAGGAAGQVGANKLTEALGVQPSGANPLIAGGIEAATAGVGKLAKLGATKTGRGALGANVKGLGAPETVDKMEDAAKAYRRIGFNEPAIPQLVQDAGGPVQYQKLMSKMQQLNLDLPFFSGVTENWLRKNTNSMNTTLAKRLGNVDAAGNVTQKSINDVSKQLRESVLIGEGMVERRLGGEMQGVFDVLPNKMNEMVSIKPVVDELTSLGIVNNPDLIKKLASGDKSEQILAGLLKKYSKPISYSNMGTKVKFSDAPIGEMEQLRKALGATFKNSESVLNKTIAQSDHHRIYKAIRQGNREAIEKLESAGKIPSGSVQKYETAMEDWAYKANEDSLYRDRLLKTSTREVDIAGALSRNTSGGLQDVRQIDAIKTMVKEDPTFRNASWSDIQDVIIQSKGFKNGNFNMPKFRDWYEGMTPEAKTAMFDKEHAQLLDDMFRVTEGPWPFQRTSGATFTSQQIARPLGILGTAAAAGGLSGTHGITKGKSGEEAMTVGAVTAAITAVSLFLAPAVAASVVKSPKALNFIKKTSSMSPKEYDSYVSAMAGGLVNAIANPDNEKEYSDALAIYSLIDANANSFDMIKGLQNTQQPQGRGPLAQ